MSKIEYSQLSPEYQIWLQSYNLLRRQDIKPGYCPAELRARQYNPSVLLLEKLLHDNPFLVVPYNVIANEFNLDNTEKTKASFRRLTYKARKWGCTMSSIKGFGISVGISDLIINPTQAVILDRIRTAGEEGVSKWDLLSVVGQYNVNLNDQNEYVNKSNHLNVELSRMRSVFTTEDIGLEINSDYSSQDQAASFLTSYSLSSSMGTFSVSEIATKLGILEQHLTRLIRRGKIKAQKNGKSWVIEWDGRSQLLDIDWKKRISTFLKRPNIEKQTQCLQCATELIAKHIRSPLPNKYFCSQQCRGTFSHSFVEINSLQT